MLIVQHFFLCYTELQTNAISRHLLAFSKIIHRHMSLSTSFHGFLWSRFWFRVRHFSRLYLKVQCNRYDVILSTKGRQRTDLLPTSAHRQTKHPSAICYSAQKNEILLLNEYASSAGTRITIPDFAWREWGKPWRTLIRISENSAKFNFKEKTKTLRGLIQNEDYRTNKQQRNLQDKYITRDVTPKLTHSILYFIQLPEHITFLHFTS